MRRSRALAAACALAGTTALVVMAAPPALADGGPTGSAYALSVKTTLLDNPVVTVDPIPVATFPEGGDESVVTVGPDLAGLVTANVLNASSNVDGDVLASAASIADVKVKNILKAKVITATCAAGPGGVVGKSSIAELTVLGQRIDVTAKADIDVLGIATVKIDEQIKDGDTLTVNAVHVTVGGMIKNIKSADIVLSQAKCTADSTGGGPTEPPTSTPTTPPTSEPPTSSKPPVTTTTTERPQGGVTPGGDDDDLAQTGVSAVLPLSLGGLLLVAAGSTALYLTRRRRAAASRP